MERYYIRAKYDINNVDIYAKIIYGMKEYIFDTDDFLNILNYEKNFIFYNENDTYPSFTCHNNKITFLEFLYNFSIDSICYNFKNNNEYDLRRNNIEYFHKYHKNVIEKYPNAIYNEGHYSKMGKDAHIMKNPYWEIDNSDSNKIYLMYCETNTLVKIDSKSLIKIREFEEKNNNKKLTFYKHSNGYILCSNKNLFIHQIITGCYGNGKGTKNISVDHIDQDPLNNCYDNLRIANRKEQEENSEGIKEGTKRERSKLACDLPDNITQDMIPKYVYYVKSRDNHGEHFIIDRKHPNCDKDIKGTKSIKKTAIQKLEEIKVILNNLENNDKKKDIDDSNDIFKLPQYYRIGKNRGNPTLFYEKRNNHKRYNYLMKLKENEELNKELLEKFNINLYKKYPELEI